MACRGSMWRGLIIVSYQHLLTALPNIYQGLEEYPSSRFSPPEDLTMPWHFAGHLNSSHLGCHKIIRPSNSLFLTFQNIQTCSIQDVQKNISQPWLCPSLCHGMQVTCQILCVAPTSRASQAAGTRLRASWVQSVAETNSLNSYCTGSTVLFDPYVYVYKYIYTLIYIIILIMFNYILNTH